MKRRDLSQVPISTYLESQTKSSTWRNFFHSNLFSMLLLFALTQGVFVISLFVSNLTKINVLSEWKGTVDAKLSEISERGSSFSKTQNDDRVKDIARLETRVTQLENDVKHVPVIETEHRRLTKDVDELMHRK